MHQTDDDVVRIEDGIAPEKSLKWATGFVLLAVAAGIVWYGGDSFVLDVNSPDFNPAIIAPVFFGGVGLYYLVLGANASLRNRRFGKSVLEVPHEGPRMGEAFAGRIRVSRNIRPDGPFAVRMRFVETFRVRNDRRSGGMEDLDNVRWETSVDIAPDGIDAREGIPFEIALPRVMERAVDDYAVVKTKAVFTVNLPGGRKVFANNRRPDSVRWILDVKAPFDGVDYYASFGIQVDAEASSDHTRGRRSRRR